MSKRNQYRLAAEMIASGRCGYACLALCLITSARGGELITPFEQVFEPSRAKGWHCWWGDPTNDNNRMARSLALLFMAEMAEEL